MTRKHAGAWLAAFPSPPLGLWIASQEFVAAARLWLGIASQADSRALLRQGVAMYGRHHALRDCLFEAARAAEQRPWREQAIDSSGKRPADVYFPAWSQGRPLALDVTISHPSQGWLPAAADMVDTLAGRVAERIGVAKSVASRQLWQRLSVVLWRGNARQVLHAAGPGPASSPWTQTALRA